MVLLLMMPASQELGPLSAVEYCGGEKGKTDEECYKNTLKDVEKIMSTLPKEQGWMSDQYVRYQGIWSVPNGIPPIVLAQKHFNPLPNDTFLATFPKSGTTWFKALVFSILNRSRLKKNDYEHEHPLLSYGPHDCVPYIEGLPALGKHRLDLNLMSSSRLYATHIPHISLPTPVITRKCKIVYVCRDPKDVLVSLWHIMNKLRAKGTTPLSIEDAFEMYCKGISLFGSVWDHMMGYWNASLEPTSNVFFVQYEEMKKDPNVTMKKLAEFLGDPFTIEEEKEGVVDDIIKLCSFENLKNLDVNKTGLNKYNNFAIENKNFFRKGEIGDSKNYLTDEMIERIDQITMEKLKGSGLVLK